MFKAAFNSIYSNYIANKPSWYDSVTFLKSKVVGLDKIKSPSLSPYAQSCKRVMKEHFLKSWDSNELSNCEGKLSTYTTFKTNFGFENYLKTLPYFEDSRRLTKFRLSAHRLLIETGRYKGIPRNERLCERCLLGEVEDEFHFLFKCQKLDFQRTQLLEVIHKSCPNLPKLKHRDQLIWVLSSEDVSVLRAISEYIKVCE